VIFTDLPLHGAFVIDIEPQTDERGFFARTVCRDEFSRRGASTDFTQQSVSFNTQRGIVRGLHFQTPPHSEEKLVRVSMGSIFDVIVDFRPGSPTYLHWSGVELSAENHRGLYIPKGIAHGFQTLTDITEVFYQMTTPHFSGSASGLRWNDPMIGITWPDMLNATLSDRDSSWPLLEQRKN
jgi:dTDP-4-dehydrorhamnose 3,5-epimerase